MRTIELNIKSFVPNYVAPNQTHHEQVTMAKERVLAKEQVQNAMKRLAQT